MIHSNEIFNVLRKKKINFYTGVPDSTLKNFINLIDKKKNLKHYPVYNEGSAVGLGIGYHLATKELACVYLQNSGLTNAINPLLSISHKKVYSIPCLLMIGWRGSPYRKKDEPQHNVTGQITKKLLKLSGIKFLILRKKKDLIKLDKLINFARRNNQAIACLVENGTITKQKLQKINLKITSDISREMVITELLLNINSNTSIVSTTGYTSRELHQLRKNLGLNKGKDFYMVGGMGHAGIVSLGFSINKKKQVLCLDGDGSLLMHLGTLRAQGKFGKSNFKHILLNNGSHESVGLQRTFVEKTDFPLLAKTLGYKRFDKIIYKKNLTKKLKKFLKLSGPSFLEIKIKPGKINNLKRPNNFIKIKNDFMKK